MRLRFLEKLEAIRPFTEAEAWGLFRLAALAEAVGWSLLISGILIDHYKLPGHRYAVPIAGQIHGTMFLIYFGVLIATYTSLEWSRKKFLAAAIAGVPPFGTLVFEQWASRIRQHKSGQVAFLNTFLFLVLNSKNTSEPSPKPHKR